MIPRYVCPRCGAVSINKGDIEHRYCRRCARFEDDPTWEEANGRPRKPEAGPPGAEHAGNDAGAA